MSQERTLTLTYDQAHAREHIAAFHRGIDATLAALSLGSVDVARAALADLFSCPTVIDERADILGDADEALERADTRRAVSLLHRARETETRYEQQTGWKLPSR